MMKTDRQKGKKKAYWPAMMRGRKAVMFTLISLVLVSMVFMSTKTDHKIRLRERSAVANDRVISVDYFINDVRYDIQRGVYIAGFRSMLGIQQYITTNGKFINHTDMDSIFEELLIEGTINGTYMSVMNDTELNVWIERIRHEAGKISIELDYEIKDVNVYHVNPWVINIDLDVELNISDTAGTARWVMNQNISTPLHITYFEDPVYTVYTYGRVINIISPSNITDFTDGQDTSNLIYHVDNSLYLASDTSPSYLMRLSGNLSNSTYGIESIVNLRVFEDANLNISEKSCVDHIYFSAQDPANWHINNTYNWFRLDDASITRYEVGHLKDI